MKNKPKEKIIMKAKKILACLLSAAVLTISSATFAAAEDVMDTGAVTAVKSGLESDTVQRLYFKSFRGTVKEVSDHWSIDGAKFVSVESSDGEPANIIIDSDTYVLDDEEIKVGSVITAYYDANAMMIMIYPPQHYAYVVVVENDSRNVKADKFDAELVSADNMLKLVNVSETGSIVKMDGSKYEGELADKVLVVVYKTSTRSIPAQTTPDRIIVLDDESGWLPQEQEDEAVVSVSEGDIFVNGIRIDAPAAFVNSDGVQMVPLRAVAEELGYEVIWNSKDRTVALGSDIQLKIGADEFVLRGESRKLAAAAVIIDSRTFVPASFFDDIM